MKLNIIIITFFSILTLRLNAQDKIFQKIENKTWFDETGFAGETIVFVKLVSGQVKAIRQINGSGVPVLFTEIHDVVIRNDTIFLLNRQYEQINEKPKTIFYTYNDHHGLFSNGKPLRILFKVPIIYVYSEKSKIIDTQVNVNDLTKLSFEKNKVYINDKVYKINRED